MLPQNSLKILPQKARLATQKKLEQKSLELLKELSELFIEIFLKEKLNNTYPSHSTFYASVLETCLVKSLKHHLFKRFKIMENAFWEIFSEMKAFGEFKAKCETLWKTPRNKFSKKLSAFGEIFSKIKAFSEFKAKRETLLKTPRDKLSKKHSVSDVKLDDISLVYFNRP